MRGAQGSGDTDWATAYYELKAAYDAYVLEQNTKLQQQKKQLLAKMTEWKTQRYPGWLEGLELPTYDIGGMVKKTGIAMVHADEGVITPEQVDMLRRLTLTSGKQSLAYQMAELNEVYGNLAAPLTHLADNSNNGLVIENATVNMNVQSIANDYDARRAGEQALEEMLRIARKSSVQSFRR